MVVVIVLVILLWRRRCDKGGILRCFIDHIMKHCDKIKEEQCCGKGAKAFELDTTTVKLLRINQYNMALKACISIFLK